jgi:hypothetical protein
VSRETETVKVAVTGWNADDESVSDYGKGDTEDAAIEHACKLGGIVEIGDVTILPNTVYVSDF